MRARCVSRRALRHGSVRCRGVGRAAGWLHAVAGCGLPCALGRGGARARKREGDGATPIGRWRLRRGALSRRSCARGRAPALPVRPIAPRRRLVRRAGDRNYNRPVRHPYPASAERLWRAGSRSTTSSSCSSYNDRPRVRGRRQRHLHASWRGRATRRPRAASRCARPRSAARMLRAASAGRARSSRRSAAAHRTR